MKADRKKREEEKETIKEKKSFQTYSIEQYAAAQESVHDSPKRF